MSKSVTNFKLSFVLSEEDFVPLITLIILLSFSFVVANSSVEEARYNQQSVNLLLQMMYPRYDYGDRNAVGSYIEISGLSFLRDSSQAFAGSIAIYLLAVFVV